MLLAGVRGAAHAGERRGRRRARVGGGAAGHVRELPAPGRGARAAPPPR